MRTNIAALAIAGLLAWGGIRPTGAQAPKGDPDTIKVDVQKLSQEDVQKIQREARVSSRRARQELQAAGTAFPAAIATLHGMPPIESLIGSRDVKVDANFDNIPLKDAIAKLFANAKQEYQIQSDVDASVNVLLKARNIRLISALEALTDQAGCAWRTEFVLPKNDKQFHVRYQIVSAAPRTFNPAVFSGGSIYAPTVPTASSDVPQVLVPRGTTWTFNVAELRQTFRCPHCKGVITTVKAKTRAAASTQWRFCPLCGKPVDMEEDEDDRRTASGRIEPGSRLRIQVVSEPDDKDYEGSYGVDSSGFIRLKTYPVSVHVIGCTTGQLEKTLTARLRAYLKEPRVNVVIVPNK